MIFKMKQKIENEVSCLNLSEPMNITLRYPAVGKITHEQVRWSNAIVNSPVVYGLIERRTLYFITGEVKHKYTEKNLSSSESLQITGFSVAVWFPNRPSMTM